MGINTALQPMWGHLRCAHMATMTITPMPAYPTATMDQAGSRAESLLALGPGAGVGNASMGAVALADGATLEAGRPFPGVEDFVVGSVTVTPVEADVASEVVDVASVAVDVPSVAVAIVPVVVDVAPVGAEAEAAMVVGAGCLHH